MENKQKQSHNHWDLVSYFELPSLPVNSSNQNRVKVLGSLHKGTGRFGHSTSSAIVVSAIVPVRPHFIKTFRPWFYLCCFMCYL
jgi:hypothetical protein